jgi:hypothetical protein
MIHDLVVSRGVTSTSAGRSYVLDHCIQGERGLLFEIALVPGDAAVRIRQHSEHQMEPEVLIAASTLFEISSVSMPKSMFLRGEPNGQIDSKFQW